MGLFRILEVVHSMDIGGLERVVLDLSKGFKNQNCSVSICCLNGKGLLGKEAEDIGINVFSLNKMPGVRWKLIIKLANIIKNGNYNLIHTHNEAGLIYGATGAILAKNRNIIHTEHGKEPNYNEKKAIKIAEGILLKRVKCVVVVSEKLKNRIIRSFKIDKNKIYVIPNGIDIEHFYQPELRDKRRRMLGIDQDEFVIGNIARMVPLKNHKFLIIIFKELQKEFPKIKLMLIGNGPLMQELFATAKDMGILDSILFLGEQGNIAELISTFDLFVLPSLTEGISLTIIEAMAAGIPVIASDVGGNSEIIYNEKTGILLPVNEAVKWIQTIKYLISNVSVRKDLAKMARHIVAERFSLNVMIKNYTEVYYK